MNKALLALVVVLSACQNELGVSPEPENTEHNEQTLLGYELNARFDGRAIPLEVEGEAIARVALLMEVREGAEFPDVVVEDRLAEWSWREGTFAVAGVDLDIEVGRASVHVVTATPQDIVALTLAGGERATSSSEDTFESNQSSQALSNVRARSAWGAAPRRCGSNESTKVKFTVHHTVTARSSSAGYEGRLRAIQSFHQNGRGWCDIAYNYLVTDDGSVWEGRGTYRAGHTRGDNAQNIGVSFIGCFHSSQCSGLGGSVPPPAMIDAGARVIGELARDYGIALDRVRVKGHRERGSTSCPGDHLYSRLEDMIAIAQGAPPLPPSCFTDVGGSTFESDICWMNDSGLTTGCGNGAFCPNDALTRGQTAVFLDRLIALLDAPLPVAATPFVDVDGHFAEDAIARLYGAGITTGVAPDRFGPEDRLTRGQLAAFLSRTWTLLSGEAAPIVDAPFVDDDGHFAEDAIAQIYGLGITTGTSATTFSPDAGATRGQMAAFLRRFHDTFLAREDTSAPQGPCFDDVPSAHFAAEAICGIAELGLTTGCSTTSFCPDDVVTRGQVAVFLDRYYRLETGAHAPVVETPFVDVPDGHFAKDAIARVFGLGLTTGTSPSTFSPDDEVTRAMVAVFLDRLYTLINGEPAPTVGTPFVDVPEGHFAEGAIARIYGLGLSTGTSPNTFSPDDSVTRAQIAAFLWRLYS